MIYDKKLEEHNQRLKSNFELSALNVVPDGNEFYDDVKHWGFEENDTLLPRTWVYGKESCRPMVYHIRRLDTERLIYRGPETK